MAKRRKNLFFGAAAQMAVMSELLLRGYNVAKPEVDIGDDVITINHGPEGGTNLVQVKARHAERYVSEEGYRAEFQLPVWQLNELSVNPLFFVFVCRLEGRWESFLWIHQSKLVDLHQQAKLGAPQGDFLGLTIQFRSYSVTASEADFTEDFEFGWNGFWPPVEGLHSMES